MYQGIWFSIYQLDNELISKVLEVQYLKNLGINESKSFQNK